MIQALHALSNFLPEFFVNLSSIVLSPRFFETPEYPRGSRSGPWLGQHSHNKHWHSRELADSAYGIRQDPRLIEICLGFGILEASPNSN